MAMTDKPPRTPKLLSLVAPVYNEELLIEEFVARATAALADFDFELVLEFEFCAVSTRSDADMELLYLLCKEGWQRSMLGEYHNQKQALSRFFISAMLQTDPVLDVVRKELCRMSPDVRIDN